MPSDEALAAVEEICERQWPGIKDKPMMAEIIDRHMPQRSACLECDKAELYLLLVEAAEMIERVCASAHTAGTPLALAAGNLIGRLHKAAEEIR